MSKIESGRWKLKQEGHKRPQDSEEPPAQGRADCVLPLDVMQSILAHLPVKSLVRFKSVCRAWYELLATPHFMKLHHDNFSRYPRNQSLIISWCLPRNRYEMSLLKTESTEMKPTDFEIPCEAFLTTEFVGCCNGLVCMGASMLGERAVLWNPATRLYGVLKCRSIDALSRGRTFVSLGLGYDSQVGDFKLVRIICLENVKKGEERVRVEVYSFNSDSWNTCEVDFEFRPLEFKNDVIVNGNPCWVAKVNDKEREKNQFTKVLVCFDSSKMVLKTVPLSSFDLGIGGQVPLIDWKGSVAAIVCNDINEKMGTAEVWVFDDAQKLWKKNYTFGPIEMSVDRFVHCSSDGKKFVGKLPNGRLILFDPETGSVKEIVMNRLATSSRVQGYTESLAFIRGMGKMAVRSRRQ